MRLRSVERPGHRATTRHLQAAYPFVAEGGLGGQGVYIGVDASGGSFVYDPFALYSQGVLRDPNMIVLGQVGFGKSSLIKTNLLRQSVFGRRGFVLDPKGEYGPLAEALGGVTVRLRPGGSVRLNPLTERAGAAAQLGLLHGVAAGALGRPPTQDEYEGLRVALELVVRRGEGEPTLPDVAEALLHPTSEMADELATSHELAASSCRDAALGLRRLCVGDLRGMFDGPTTAGLDLSARFVVVDLSEVGVDRARHPHDVCDGLAARDGRRAARARRARGAGRREDPARHRRGVAGALSTVHGRDGAGLVEALALLRREQPPGHPPPL